MPKSLNGGCHSRSAPSRLLAVVRLDYPGRHDLAIRDARHPRSMVCASPVQATTGLLNEGDPN